jgi:uncharacterized protein
MANSPKIKLNVLSQNQPISLDEVLALPDAPLRPADVPAFDRREQSFEGRGLRTSSYTIYVELPGDPDRMLLVHGYTGAYDRVSRGVVAYLRSLEKGATAKPLYGSWSPEPASDGAVSALADQTMARLQKRGYLTPMTDAEEIALFSNMSSMRQHAAVHDAPSYVVMPTYQCNLRCAYCFQDHMRTDPAHHHLLRTMDSSMVDRIFQGMARIDAAHGIPDGAEVARSIILFGGEPLLEDSRPVIEYIVHKACERGAAKLSAITNATDLHAYQDLLGPGKIGQLQITVDGPPRVHDQRRIYADGSGSFARIARNVTMALDRGVLISIRMNVDRSNLPLLPELAEEFIAQGWDKHRGFSAYVAPVHGDLEHDGKKTTYTSWQLNQAMTELKERHPSVRRIGGSDDALLERARQLFEQRSDPMPRFRSNFCGAHGSMYVIDAFGDIYACWERTGDPTLRIGSIDPSGTVFMNRALLENWRSRSVASNPTCRKCRYAVYCGGGCAVLAEDQHGDIHANHCDGFGKRFRASVAEAYADHVAGVKREVNAERVCDM